MSSQVSVTSINMQVSNMLQNIGGGLQDNQLLQAVIALLILQSMLSQDGGSQQSTIQNLVDILGSGLGSGQGQGSQQTFSMQSATNVLQIQQQSTTLSTNQAVVGANGVSSDSSGSVASGGTPDRGGEIDLTA